MLQFIIKASGETAFLTTQQVMDEIFAFLKEKKLVPVSGEVFHFGHIREAIEAQDAGKVNGKIVVVMKE